MGDAGALGMRGKRADLSGLVFGNLTVLLTWYRLEVPPMPLARADARFNQAIFARRMLRCMSPVLRTKRTFRG